MIETPVYDLTNFRVHFGRLTLKAYTKGEHVLRSEAIVYNTKELNCRRGIDMFGEIVARLAGMAERFCSALDCVDIGFIPDNTLDDLPTPPTSGATRVGGIDLNRPRMHHALAAVLALAAAPNGFNVTQFAEQVHTMTGQTSDSYTTRHAAYDLRKIRGKQLIAKPAGPAATTCHSTPPAPSPPCSPSATTSSPQFWPESAAHDKAANPKFGPRSTVTTKPCGSTCTPCSTTSASPQSSRIDNKLWIPFPQVSSRGLSPPGPAGSGNRNPRRWYSAARCQPNVSGQQMPEEPSRLGPPSSRRRDERCRRRGSLRHDVGRTCRGSAVLTGHEPAARPIRSAMA